MEKEWRTYIEKTDFAFQPIVNIHTGECFGVEVLLRDYAKAGFNTIQDFFDEAFKHKSLFIADLILRDRAFNKFTSIKNYENLKLFYNIDNRLLFTPDYVSNKSEKLLQKYEIPQNSVCFEVTEHHRTKTDEFAKKVLTLYKALSYKIAIDDFGSGFLGLQLLYQIEPDYIKIDRFFIDNIEKDGKKKLFVSNILNIAHMLGIQVIAEEVETIEEFNICKELGCDYVQGFLIQKPMININEIKEVYDIVLKLGEKNSTDTPSKRNFIERHIRKIEPIVTPKHGMKDLMELFNIQRDLLFIPIVNKNGEPAGIVSLDTLNEAGLFPHEENFDSKEFKGKIIDRKLIRKRPICDLHNRIETLLDLFSANGNINEILIVNNGVYSGYLSSRALLSAVSEENIAITRDQNPLSKMPGSNIVKDYIANTLANRETKKLFVYFDFHSFKPFNDNYGFKTGDRAVLIFADILKNFSGKYNFFTGHIGGDEFFISFREVEHSWDEYFGIIKMLIRKFNEDILSLYNPIDRKKGFIYAYDRDGRKKRFPFINVSGAVVCIEDIDLLESYDQLLETFSNLRSEVKKSGKLISLRIF